MALERLTLAPVLLDGNNGNGNGNGGGGGGGEDMNKAPRLPRWTRQELLVLIQGKRVAENRVRRGRTAVMMMSSSSSSSQQVEPKWSSVSSYCKRHGVNRGPVQCRKRWSNLAGDFKKIKEWESQIKEEAESFWLMRNDLRRERKLPGFFDREVYDILDGGGGDGTGDKSLLLLSLAPSNSNDDDTELVFDSGRPTSTADDGGLFSDEVLLPTPTAPTPISATQYEPSSPPEAAATTQQEKPRTGTEEQDQDQDQDQEEENEKEKEGVGKKRKRPATDINESSLQNQLIEAMERNGRLLTSQLEIQNTNSHLDREQRKDHANTLFAVLNKLADAMVRIADKL
ncbi:hypothetical protein OSB04_009089 [Centaurea solstitialis]|uniref:Myb-like domain-containing protein n=1 Tax=Centaurea solstitialis TaxID=347529 RepID=A0AA38WTI9_9ASTR|nr:hypothetical protein OSB04_009089 [Centaurea solstitialis]